ncbi:MAG: hypothetical protein ACLQVD_01930 [Capsulimonadaceae bacterium]
MKTGKIIKLSIAGLLLSVYLVVYGVACGSGTIALSSGSSGDQSAKNLKTYSVNLVALQPYEFGLWFTHGKSSIPADVASSFVMTKDRLNVGLFALEFDNTAQIDAGGSVGTGALTASAIP